VNPITARFAEARSTFRLRRVRPVKVQFLIAGTPRRSLNLAYPGLRAGAGESATVPPARTRGTIPRLIKA